jgi:hypothetical protein
MARNASRVARALGQEDGLHLGFEKLEIQRRRCSGGRNRLLAQQPNQQNPANDYR